MAQVTELNSTPVELAQAARRSRAVRDAFVAGAVSRLLGLLASLLVVRLCAHSLGAEGYGVLATLAASTAALSVADFGLGGGLITELTGAYVGDDAESAGRVLSAALVATCGLAALTAAIVPLVLVVPWHAVFGPQSVSFPIAPAAALCGVGMAVAFPAGVGDQVLFARQQGRVVGAWNACATVLSLLACLLASALHAGLLSFTAAVVLAPLAVRGVQTWLVLRRRPAERPHLSAASRDGIRRILRAGGLFFGLNLAVMAAYQSDTLIVAAVRGTGSAAIYAVCSRLAAVAVIPIADGLEQTWPALADAMARGEHAWVRRSVLRGLAIVTGLGVILVAVLTAAGPALCRLWVGPRLEPGRLTLLAFGVWTGYSLAATVLSYLMNAARVVRPQLVMAGVMVVVNVPVSVVLTRAIGVAGPVLGSLAAHVLCAGIPSALICRRLLLGQGR